MPAVAAVEEVVAPSTPVGRARPRKSRASTPPLLQSRAAAEKVAQLSSELTLSSELVEKLQALSSELVEKLAAVTAEKTELAAAHAEALAAAHAELVHDAGLEARCVRLESELGAVLEGRQEAQEHLTAAKAELRQMSGAQQEARALLGGERERAARAEAEAEALGGRLGEAAAERDEALRARAVAEAEKLTAEAEVSAVEERARLAATAQQEARQEAELGWTAAQGRAREAAARVAELEALHAAAEEARGALQEEGRLLQSRLDAVTAEKRGAEQREALAHERARVAEQQRQILLRLSSGKQQALAEQQAQVQAQVQLRHDLGVGGRSGGAAAPWTPATGVGAPAVVSRPSPPPSPSASPSWRRGEVHHEQ